MTLEARILIDVTGCSLSLQDLSVDLNLSAATMDDTKWVNLADLDFVPVSRVFRLIGKEPSIMNCHPFSHFVKFSGAQCSLRLPACLTTDHPLMRSSLCLTVNNENVILAVSRGISPARHFE